MKQLTKNRVMRRVAKIAIALVLCVAFILPNLLWSSAMGSPNTENVRRLTYTQALNLALENVSELLLIDGTLEHFTSQRELMQRQISDFTWRIHDVRTYQESISRIQADITHASAMLNHYIALDDPEYAGQVAFWQSRLNALRSMLELTFALHSVAEETRENLETSRDIMRQRLFILDRRIESLEISVEMVRVNTELNLRNLIVRVSQTERDIEILESAIAISRENLRHLRILHQHGRISNSALRAAEINLEQENIQLETLRLSLNNERMALSRLLNLPITRPISVAIPNRQVNLPTNLNVFISDRTERDLSIRQLEIDVEIARAELRIANLELSLRRNAVAANGSNASERITRERAYEQAVITRDNTRRSLDTIIRGLDEAKEALELDIRSRANEINRLVLQQSSISLELENAQRQHEIAEAFFIAGRRSRLDVDRTVHLIMQLENDLERNRERHWVDTFRLLA
jgi:hypothetical protein